MTTDLPNPEPAIVPLSLWPLVTLQIVVSAASLVVEIVAGRMIAPYVGMSLYTWTAIIAVVLAGFSAGHWWGGRIAARPVDVALRRTGWAMLAAALSAGAAGVILRAVAGPVLSAVENPLLAITLIAMAVFFLPSLFAGIPAPVLAVAAIRGRTRSEEALGLIFAAGAVGAIAGTLLAGFLFISWLGSMATLAAIAAIYAVSAASLFGLGRATRRQWAGAGLALLLTAATGLHAVTRPAICDRESRYFCIRTVALAADPAAPVKLMVLDHLAHGISDGTDPVRMMTEHGAMLDALPRMRMGGRDFTSFHIGGGSYTVPRAWAARGIGGITVAEIDPAVTEAAIRDFWFDPATARVLHRDARTVLSRDPARYDVIIGDAFADIAVPPHLITAEFAALVASRLTPDGVYAMNVVDHAGGLKALAAMVATLRTAFPSVEVWTEARAPEPGERRVFVLLAGQADSPVSVVALNAPDPVRFAALGTSMLDRMVGEATVLTDDYAPIDRLMGLHPVND